MGRLIGRLVGVGYRVMYSVYVLSVLYVYLSTVICKYCLMFMRRNRHRKVGCGVPSLCVGVEYVWVCMGNGEEEEEEEKEKERRNPGVGFFKADWFM